MNIQSWFPSGLTGLISFQSKGCSRIFSSITTQKHPFFGVQPSLWSNSHIHTWLLEKPLLASYKSLSAKWCLCFLICCLGLPKNKHLLISQLQSLSTMILEPKKRKSVTLSTFSPFICNEVMGSDVMILVFWMLSFKPAFHSPLLPSSRGSLVPLHFLPLKWYHLHIWGCLYFSWQSWLQLMIHPAWHFTWCNLNRS